MNLFLCQVCDYETPDKENFNVHASSNDHKEKVKYYEIQEKIQKIMILRTKKDLIFYLI